MNCPHQSTVEVNFNDCKIIRPYRQGYEWSALRVVTYKGPKEYLIKFKKRKYMLRAMKLLIQNSNDYLD